MRYQLAFTLGEWPDPAAGRALVRLQAADPDQPELLTAVLSSAVPHVKPMIETILREYPDRPPIALFQRLLSLAAARNENGPVTVALEQIGRVRGKGYSTWQFSALSGFLDGLDRQHLSFSEYRTHALPELSGALDGLTPLFQAAPKIAEDGDAPEDERLAAIRVLGRGFNAPQDLPALAGLLRPQLPSALRRAALESLKRLNQPAVSTLLLEGWRSYEPSFALKC